MVSSSNIKQFDIMYDEYEYYAKKYQKEFGKNTIVAYQCGGFYEIYSIGDGLVDIKEISDILGVDVSRRNKQNFEISKQNCYFMGWPIHAMSKFVKILIDNNYTVVVVNQIEENQKTFLPNKECTILKGKNRLERCVSQILSKGTYCDQLSLDHQIQGKFIMCIFIDEVNDSILGLKNSYLQENVPINIIDLYAFGVSIIDVTTGENMFFEIKPNVNDPTLSIDELYRLCVQYPPCELLLLSYPVSEKKRENMMKMLSENLIRSCKTQVIDKLGFFEDFKSKSTHQNYILSKVFGSTGMLSPIEFVDLEKLYYARISFVSLMEYLLYHNETLIIKLKKPVHTAIDTNDDNQMCSENNNNLNCQLILSYNAAEQLDIENGLLFTLNKSVSLLGKRYFRHRLMTPTFNTNRLKDSYAKISLFLKNGYENVENLRKELKNVYDLERLFRKVVMGTCTSNDIQNILKTLLTAKKLMEIVPDYLKNNEKEIKSKVEEILNYLENILFNVDKDGNNLQTLMTDELLQIGIVPFFKLESYKEQSTLLEDILNYKLKINRITEDLNKICGGCYFKIEKNERDGYYLICTNKRYHDMKQQLFSYTFEQFSFKNVNIKTQTNTIKISHTFLDEISNYIQEKKTEWEKLTQSILKNILFFLTENYFNSFHTLCLFLGSFDFHLTCAYNSIKRKLCCPIIEESSNPFINCEELRHPIVEDVEQSIPFVGNDIQLGGEHSLGCLLYGLNAAGKSTLMKSIAISIIMAQSGMFVPATTFHFFPYKYIFTRITRGDDIQKGQSTFMIEMQELRNILKRSNEHSLVIGDELCCGTESVSAMGIVSSGLYHLALKNKCSFVFTTHLHDLTTIPQIQELNEKKKLDICHLHVEYDPLTHKLIYDRKLRKGQGLTVYGLEVCKALDLDNSFLKMANDIRHAYIKSKNEYNSQYFNTIDHNNPRKSKYNSKLYVDTCNICFKKQANEVHHILEQKNADKYGFIGHHHKNRLSNLLNICEECHDKIHAGEIEIEGYVQTSFGKELRKKHRENEAEVQQGEAQEEKEAEVQHGETQEKKEEENEDLVSKIKRMRCQQGFSFKKIADELQISIYNVKKYLVLNHT